MYNQNNIFIRFILQILWIATFVGTSIIYFPLRYISISIISFDIYNIILRAAYI